MPSGIAIDLQEIPKSLDLRDSTDPLDRNYQIALSESYSVASALRAVQGAGAGNYPRPIHIAPASQTTYETLVNNAMSAVTDVITALVGILNAS